MRTAKFFSALVLFSLALPNARAEDEKQSAVDLVNKAIEYYKSNGKDKAFAEISVPKGQFTKENGELYVFVYDMTGTVVAHGQNPQEIGLNKLQAKDKNGKFYVRERIDLAKTKGEGWQDYMFKEPKTGKSAPKTSYIKKVDDYIFGCGVYK
jgi:signal transduction histidine kinase